jgi:hypothetical protein
MTQRDALSANNWDTQQQDVKKFTMSVPMAHTSNDCDKNLHNYKCINCLKARLPSNHAVWDKECPSMLSERKKKADRNPDSMYKFFPTKEEWTWERKEDSTGNAGTSTEVGQRMDARGGRSADQGRWWTETRDVGWKEMRARREAKAAVRNVGNRRPPVARANDKGKGRDTSDRAPAPQGPINGTQSSIPS